MLYEHKLDMGQCQLQAKRESRIKQLHHSHPRGWLEPERHTRTSAESEVETWAPSYLEGGVQAVIQLWVENHLALPQMVKPRHAT